MSYPYDTPSPSMQTIWNSGLYTPDDMVNNIRDNITPINKNSIRNSVGHQLSLIENYVNSNYLGRPDIPVTSGFFTTVSGVTIYSTLFECSPSGRLDNYTLINADRIYLRTSHFDERPSTRTITADTISSRNYEFLGLYPEYTSLIDNSGYYHMYQSSLYGKYYSNLSPISGLSISYHTDGAESYQQLYDRMSLNPTGLYFYYNDIGSPSNNEEFSINVNPLSGIGYITGYLTIGTPHINNAVLTVAGDAYFNTSWGQGLRITGDNDVYTRVLVDSGVLFLGTDDNDDMMKIGYTGNATNDINGIGIVFDSNVGFNSVTPTGRATFVSGTDAAAITAMKQVLINYGLMLPS